MLCLIWIKLIRRQKINNFITLPGRGGCNEHRGTANPLFESLEGFSHDSYALKIASTRSFESVCARSRAKTHNEHNSAAESLGIWSKDVMQPGWAGHDNLHHTLSITSWWERYSVKVPEQHFFLFNTGCFSSFLGLKLFLEWSRLWCLERQSLFVGTADITQSMCCSSWAYRVFLYLNSSENKLNVVE